MREQLLGKSSNILEKNKQDIKDLVRRTEPQQNYTMMTKGTEIPQTSGP